jgi:hypothetical protein
MIPRSALLKLPARAKMPAHFFSGRATRFSLHSLVAMVLSAGLFLAGNGRLLAQDVPPPPPDAAQQDQQAPQDDQTLPQYGAQTPQDNGTQAAPGDEPQATGQQGQPLGADQLDQLVAPIALYPDSLVAQILASATYPTQIVEADRWLEAQGNAPADQIASDANEQQWDPSVKALTAFPSVLSQLDKNLQWTTDLGNAYYNQPQDVMDSVQRMRQQAQEAGNLQSNQQQTVDEDNGEIAIAPSNPDVVYVPVYDPWAVYGAPIYAFPGYYYAPPPGLFIGVGFGFVRFGYGIPLRPWAPWGWGWHNWNCGWHNRVVVYNRSTYITRSTTVVNRGFNRPGAPPVQLAGRRGSFVNHPGYAGYTHNVASGARPVPNAPLTRPGNFNNHAGTYRAPVNGFDNRQPSSSPRSTYNSGQTYHRQNQSVTPYRPSAPQQNNSHPAPTYNRSPQNYSRPAPQQNYSRPAPQQNYSRPAPAPHMSSAPHGGGGGGGGGDHRH